MSDAYVRTLEEHINQLNFEISRKSPEYIRRNQNYILYGIIYICLYMSVLIIKMNIPASRMNNLFTATAKIISKLNYQDPNVALPNSLVKNGIINLLTDSIVKVEYGDFVIENIERGFLPIDLSDSGNLNNNRDGSILNRTERVTSMLLTQVKEVLQYRNTDLYDMVKLNDTTKIFFRILLGLMINMGSNSSTVPISQILEDFFSRIQPVFELVDDTNPEYARKLVDRIKCPICLENERNIVLNCGHTICSVCAGDSRLINCPECRKPITQRIKMYFNKYLKYKTKYMQLRKLNRA